ncbi:hypothetical protein [Kitasatospora sp. MBT66]|uniref:hypothetical protein n=1 Tax=Kitasatospora sp. MBT66 TaxID=1444769 RepID=UPI0005B891D4|nr:hypothetical protein [Kitasatospora sp. MBT66]
MTEQTPAPDASDGGDGTPPETRVIVPTQVVPAADQPPRPDFPPFSPQDRAGLAKITDAPAAPRPAAPEQPHNPNPQWWRDLTAKVMGTEEVNELPVGGAQPVTATVTVKTTIPQRPAHPPRGPAAQAGGGSGGGWNGRGPGPGAPSEGPPANDSNCPHCGGQFTACSCPLHKTPPTTPPAAAPTEETEELEDIEQEVTVLVKVGDEKAKEKSRFKRALPEVLKATPNKTGNGWHRARVLWTVKWIGPVVPAWGFDLLEKAQHLILWFQGPGEQFWMSVTFVGVGALIGWRTRGWYPPLAWVLRMPFATALVAALTVTMPLT